MMYSNSGGGFRGAGGQCPLQKFFIA